MPRGKAAGIARERQVKELLIADGWLAFRSPASLGVCDVIALKAGERPRMVEVKSTTGNPYGSRFSPAHRRALSEAAKRAGADAFLCWWAPRREPKWIPENEWPEWSCDATVTA